MPLPEQKDSPSGYALGHHDDEIRRLQKQGAFMEPFTRRWLVKAKIEPGMTVLDLGTGAGDVALLLAELVGPAGRVIGIDRSAAVLEVARRRAQAAGLDNVSFLAGDVHELDCDGVFDAVAGRFILFHVKEPAAMLRKLVGRLKPAAVVAFQDYNLYGLDAYPPSELYTRAKGWIAQGFLAGGADPSVGLKIGAIFHEAGLPRPRLLCETSMSADLAWEVYDHIAMVIRTLAPVLTKTGLASAEEIGIDTLADRLRHDVAGKGGVGRGPDIVSAWTRLA